MTRLTLVTKRAALTIASLALGLSLSSPAMAQHKLPASVLKKAKNKCIDEGKKKCHTQKLHRDRTCFSTLDRALMKALNDKKKCDKTYNQAKASCTRSAMLCHRSQSGSVCASKLTSCNQRAQRRHTRCLRPIKAFKKLAKRGFKRCSNQSKRAYNKCVKAARNNCKLKKNFRKFIKKHKIRR